MLRRLVVAMLGVVAALTPLARPAAQEGGDMVTLDITAVDDKGRFVPGLTAQDVTVKEDGDAVELLSFAAVTPADPDVVRSIVILLDDLAVPPLGREPVQRIANAIVARMNAADEIAVVRLGSRTDEPFGDRREALARIDGYLPGRQAVTDWVMPQRALTRMATVAEQLQSLEDRRKIIVCIGAPANCNVPEPAGSIGNLWPPWRSLMGAAGRSNVAVYAIIPARARYRRGGVVEVTGGELVATMSDLRPALDRVLQDAGHYYLAGYWPQGRARDLHAIDVKARRKGVHVTARRLRGGGMPPSSRQAFGFQAK